MSDTAFDRSAPSMRPIPADGRKAMIKHLHCLDMETEHSLVPTLDALSPTCVVCWAQILRLSSQRFKLGWVGTQKHMMRAFGFRVVRSPFEFPHPLYVSATIASNLVG